MNKKIIVLLLSLIAAIALLVVCIGIDRRNEMDDGIFIEESDEEGVGDELIEEPTDAEGVTEENTQSTEFNAGEQDDAQETQPGVSQGDTQETKPSGSQGSTQETKPNGSQGGTQETQPTEPAPELPSGYCCEYAAYSAMSPAKQQAYMEHFPSVMDFIAWCQKAQLEHEAHDKSEEVGGDINIGDYMG